MSGAGWLVAMVTIKLNVEYRGGELHRMIETVMGKRHPEREILEAEFACVILETVLKEFDRRELKGRPVSCPEELAEITRQTIYILRGLWPE